MKHLVLTGLIVLLAFVACEPLEDIYRERDKLFSGYVDSLEYALIPEDYATISSLALKNDPGDTVRARFISSNRYFTDQVNASDYLPAFIRHKYPALAQTSLVKLYYSFYSGYPEYLLDFVSPEEYNTTDENYQSAGELQGIYKTFIGIDNPYGYISGFLKDSIKAPDQDDIFLAFYKYTRQITDPSETANLTSDDLKLLVDYVRTEINYDYVNVWGDAEYYYGADSYFGNFDLRLSKRKDFNIEGFEGINRQDDADSLLWDRLFDGLIYILRKKFPGAVPVVGSDTVYYNISYTTFEEDLHVYYAVYKCISMGPPPEFRLIAGPTEDYLNYSTTVKNVRGNYFRFDGNEWNVIDEVYCLSSVDYDEMGSPGINDFFSELNPPGNYLPRFLTLRYPYAQDGKKIAIAYKYNSYGTTIVLADEYRFNGSWAAFDPLSIKQLDFVHTGSQWTALPDSIR